MKSLTRAAVSLVAIPVCVVADSITLGGVLTDRKKPYTAEAAEDAMKNLLKAGKP